MGNHQTTKLSNHQTVRRSNHQTFQRSNAAEECTMHNAPCTMSGMTTSRAPRGRLGHVARWAAVAAVAAGMWVSVAREANAWGWWDSDRSWITVSFAGGANSEYRLYNNGITTEFNTHQFGGLNPGQKFIIKGYRARTWDNSSGEVEYYYSVDGGEGKSLGKASVTSNPNGSGNQEWSKTGLSIDVTAGLTTVGTHTVSVWGRSKKGSDEIWDPGNNNNFTAKFYDKYCLWGSYINVNGTWYYGSASANNPWTADAGNFNGVNLGSLTGSFTLGGQAHLWERNGENSFVNWNGGSVTLKYKIDNGAWQSLTMGHNSYNQSGYSNNNRFQTGGTSWSPSTIDTSALTPGSHTLTVYFVQEDNNVNDDNGGSYFVANFATYGPTTINDTSVQIGGAGNGYRVWVGKKDTIVRSMLSSYNDSNYRAWTIASSQTESGAAYAGESLSYKDDGSFSLHRTSTTGRGFWSTTSGGNIRYVKATWSRTHSPPTSGTYANRDINVYGKNSAYAAGNLDTSPPTGTQVAVLTNRYPELPVSSEVVINGSYSYSHVGFCSPTVGRNSLVTELIIEWEKAGTTTDSASWGDGVTLTGLSPSTTYTWGVANGTTLLASGTFTTAAAATPQTVAFGSGATTVAVGGTTAGNAKTATVTTPATGGGAITYSSSDTDVATVDPDTGVVTGVAVGTATITATAAAVTGYAAGTATYTIEVVRASQTVTLTGTTSVNLGSSVTLTASTTGDGSFTFSADPSDGVTLVQGTGANANKVTVTGAKVGSVVITATAAQTATYSQSSGTLTVTVNAVVPTVTTPTATLTGAKTETATLGAKVTENGGVALTGGGVVYSSTKSGTTTLVVGGSECTSASLSSAPTVDTPFTKDVSGLTPGTKYYYRGWAQNGSASGYGYSEIGNFTTKCLAPSAASGLSATATSSSRIELSWTAATAASGSGGSVKYLVLQTTDPNAPAFTPVDGTAYSTGASVGEGGVWTVKVGAGTSTTPAYTGLSADTPYYYAVYAYQEVGTDASTIAYAAGVTDSATTQTDAPSAWTSGVTCDSTGGKRATLSWTANSGAAGYMVVIKQGAQAPANDVFTQGEIYAVDQAIGTAGAVVKYVGANNSSVTISGLNGNTKYTAKVFAYNGSNWRAYVTGSSSVTFTTDDVTGPKVWLTGVDTNAFLVNWAETANTGGYLVEVEDGSGNTAGPWANSFSGDEGWASSTSDSTGYLTIGPAVGSDNEKWYLNTVRRYPTTTATVQGETEYGYLYLTAGGSFVDTPVLPGDVTEVRVKWRNGGGDRTLRLDVATADSTAAAATTGVKSWTTTGSGNTAISVYNTATISTKGKRLRFYNNSGSGNTLYLHHIALTMKGVEGHSAQVDGLSDGTSYTALVSALPDGEPGEATATTGVVPGAPSATELRNKVTFTWTAASGASGYLVDATLTNVAAVGASWATKSPANSLNLTNSGTGWGSQEWCYTNSTGATVSGNNGALTVAPSFKSGDYSGHHLGGLAGNTLMSTNFPIGGASAMNIQLTVGGWNSSSTYGSTKENARVNVYYKLDGYPWCWIGTATPTADGDGHLNENLVFNVPTGGLDGTNIAFKIVAPNAKTHVSGSTRTIVGPYVRAITVTRTMPATTADYGYYGTNSLSGYPQVVNGTSHTVTVGGSGTSVYFRVQALQGSTSDPTARSVWKASKGTTTAYTAPSAITFSSVTRNSMTVSWTAGNTTDLSKYVLQRSTASDFSSGVTSYDVTGGTSQAITGLSASTKYYYRVKAVGTDGQESAWSSTANQTTSGFPGPATVTASGESRNGMTLTWTAVSGAASYNVQWTTCAVSSSETQEGTQCPSSTRAYDTHSTTEWTYRKGYSASAGYAAGAYPVWDSSYGHLLIGQYGSTTYKPGVESPNLDLSDALSAKVVYSHRYFKEGTNTLTGNYSPVTLYYSLDGGTTWTAGGTSVAGTSSWVERELTIPSAALGRKNVKIQLRGDKAAAYKDTSVDAWKRMGAGVKDIRVMKVPTGGDYTCAATQSRNVSGTTTDLTGLNPETLYYFRVQAVGSDSQTSSWTAGSSSTTAFLGPEVEVTGSTRYTLTAEWDAHTESGYTTSYDVQLTGCANAGAEAVTAASCPAQNLDWGTSAGDWTYQREYSGGTASSYPKYENGVHKLWGQYSYTSTEPGILSPELDLAGYVSASVDFTHMYVNRANMSGVTLEYSLDEGANWTVVENTGEAAGYTVATGSSRSIPLPSEALAGGVKLRLRTTHATNYDADPDPSVTTYMVQGASIANLKVTARGAGGGDYSCGSATTIYNTSATSYTFTGLDAGQSYYVQVRTVMTPSSGPVEMSSWSETSGVTAAPQDPPDEVWAEDIRQNHMTVAWNEVEGATAGTRYELQVTGCESGTSSETAVQPSSMEADLGEGDDWAYIGGGTEVSDDQDDVITGRGTYPAYAGGSEKSQVLAGNGEPGLESVEFSTMGATAATLTFNHGRWYNRTALASAAITPSYSTDGGETWTELEDVSGSDMSGSSDQYATHARSVTLPAAALGHAHVKVRLVAKAATVTDGVPVGAAIRSAKVTLTKGQGNYDSCSYLRTFPNLSNETLSQALEGLTANHTYYFRVRASDGTQYGAWVEGTAKTLAAPATPTPAPWAVNVGRHAMTIRWQPVEGAETYTVVVYQGGSEVRRFTGVANTEQTVTGLSGSTTYTFKVSAQADGESSALSAEGTATTTAKLRVTGLRAEDILDTSMTLKWDYASGVTYTLHWGEASASGTTTLNQEVACPASSLKRSDAGNKWFYFGGNGTWPAYWTSTTQPATDHGHALIYGSGDTAPGIQSRWFSTFDASAAYVEFMHGRFNAGADSTVLVEYSVDGGTTWATAGTAPSTDASTPTEERSIPLPADALGRRSVMVRLTATGASGNKGAHIKDLKVRVVTCEKNASEFTEVDNAHLGSTGSYALTGLTTGKRYWFEMSANEGGSAAADDNAKAETTAATRTQTTGAVKSQGFEGLTDGTRGALDAAPWAYTIRYIPVQNGAATPRAWQSGDPVVEVVADENPLYGDRALRMSGSAAANVYGVVEFNNYNPGGANSWVVTIPFAARDLASGENLWVSYSTDGGSTWVAPANATATLTKSGMTMGKVARGGDDALNQNWPYNRGLNSTTRPLGDAYSFEVASASQISVRIAFCGNSGGAAHYFYIDGVTLTRKPGMPTPVSAAAQDSGGVLLTWTPPSEQGVVILRGQDERHVPTAPVDINNLPHGYEIVMNGDSPYWPNSAVSPSSQSFTDPEVQSGWTYFYYFYGAIDNEDGTYTLGTTPNTANTLVKGMVQAIASQGWDDFDIHPWKYRVGRVTNPGRSSDYGYWKANGMNATTVAFVENEYEVDSGTSTAGGGFEHDDMSSHTYSQYYSTGTGSADTDYYHKQLGISSQTNYYGGHSFRLSGGGSATYSGTHIWTDYNGNVKTNTNPAINTNNAAIEFANVDLSGYKNVEFTMHFAGMNLNGGNDLHVAVSTNGGASGTWLEVGNDNAAGWQVHESHYDYGRAISDGDTRLSGNWDFYFEDSASATPYGNPYVLQVPDSVTQMMVRVMFYDSNGGSRRDASYFIDEVRLTGEVAIPAPKPVLTDITKTTMTATWEPVTGATGYNVKLTACEKADTVKLQEGFVLNVLDNGWTGEGAYELNAAANRRGSGYGVSLNALNEAVISPMVGGASTVSFWLSSSSASATTAAKMEVQARAEGESTWVTVAEYTIPGNSWSQKSVALPRRQWQQVRFVKTLSPSSRAFYIDDVVISGGGNYETCSTKLVSDTTTATSYEFTGLTGGQQYFVEVQAYGSPAGYLAYSAWAETADFTPGTFEVKSDGFEMTRSTWGASEVVPILVMAVNADHAYSEVTVPTGDPAVGATFGQGVVVAKGTEDQSGAGFEHVVPYGSRTDAVDQKYVVYWKHGSYWEGRLETNVVLNTYVCAAADAFAVTNGTSMPATGDQAAFNTGKGWAGPWHVETVPWSGAWAGQETRNDSRPYGLLETNQLWGTGGNMLVLYPTNENKKVEIKRTLATPLSKSSEWWGMFTMKIYYSGPNKWAGIQLLDESGANKVSIGKLWNAKDSSNANEGKVIGFQGSKTKASNYVLNDGQTCVVVFKWDGSKMWLKTFYRGSDTEPQWARTATFPGFDVSETLSMDDIHAIRLVAENGSGLLYPVWFDEIRIGSSWEELVGKEPVPPFPVAAATTHAVMDGKEMIRLDWVKPAAGTDTTPDPDVERPAATRVYVLEKNVNSPFTADQLAWKTHGVGESSTIGDAVVTLLYNGSGTELEHVVLPGTSHRYAFISYAAGVFAESATEVSTDTTTGNPLTMDKYGETEYVNPFSYTNSFEVSGSGTGTEWRGGNGFTNAGGSTVHFWATGDGQNGTTANAGTWVPVKPASAPAKMRTEIPNYKASAGNVMKVSPAANTSASLGRTLAQDWGGEAGKTFYIAYRVAYTYTGINKWVGLKLIDNSGSHRGVFVGKPGTSESSKQNLLSIDPGGGLGIGFGNYGLNGSGDAYLVVAKVQWTAADKVNVYAMAKYADGVEEFPDEEPTTGWNAQWINMTFAGVHMIELLAGGTGADVTPGDTYFDEIRFGGSWDDLLGPKVPTDVWMAGLTGTGFLGDYVVNNITSKPHGPGQSAKHLLSSAAEPEGAAWAAGVDAAYVREITTETPTQSEWIATNQFKATGTLYAYGSATGDGETVYSWQHTSDSQYMKNTYTVSALPAPVLTATSDQGYKVPLSWTQGSSGGRTFEEVMIVRYADQASYNLSEASLHPEQGKAYYVGDTFSYAQNEARYATVIYRGTATGYTNRPCSNGTTYYYAAYTVNNNYYSDRTETSRDSARPSGDGGEITVDGDPTDWVGTPAEPWNSSIFSEGELIWTDKRGEERTDRTECTSADITEFRVKADSTNVYFLLQLNGGTVTAPTNAHIAVGLDTRLSTESTDMNWLADESYTFLGGAYYTNSPAFHYPKIQMAVHWVGGDRNEWQVELYDINSASWHAPRWWKASSALKSDGSGEPIATATPCVEWVVPRSELGVDWASRAEGATSLTGRFSVATFLNSGSWNNEAAGVVRIASNSCAAVDALAIAPYGANDKDYTLGAWDEGLKNNNVDFWMDARFGASALLSDDVPSTPGNPSPANDGTGAGNPVLQWSNSTDSEGFVTGWLLEVADTPNFGGDGGHTENGSVLYRVNIEMTPALAAALAADSSRKISYKPMTNCKEFWWRVRARDNAGQLSLATVQHYTVTGKQDNDGPVATLKYVGTQVEQFFTDTEYRAEVERNGEAYAIMDSEFGGNRSFGFVIEWYDINGVYATNHMRAWVPEYDGTDDCEDGHSRWPAGKVPGDYTWNILATNSDGTAFGRVSPNWDLMMINTNTSGKTDSKYYVRDEGGIYYGKTITVTNGAGKELSLQWMWTNSITLPTEIGDTITTNGWVIQWGYDDPFKGVDETDEFGGTGETLKSFDEGGTRISCNGVQYLTNFVNGVFGLPEYDPDVDLYLTLSAEDCCTSDQWGEQPWDPWPPSRERDHQGSYRGLSCSEYPGQAHENVLTGGWCEDGPNPARNVTVNQLIKIHVKDNDVVPPIASTNRWAATAVDEDGTEFKPSLLVSTNTIAASSGNTTWATITGKLPRREGVQRDTMYQLTDAMMVGGTRPLSFFFNVYDDYIESGTQRGTAATTPNTGNTRSLTNSAFVVKTWDPALNEGAGAWVASTENTANFVADGSYISDMVHDGSGWHEAAGTKGTGPSTVLRWDFATSDINSLFGMTDILSYIGTHSDGVTNVVQLHAWDSDDNRAGDQADAEITFGRLLFSDDDATSPEISRSNLLGTGTNMVKFGALALDTFSKGDATGSGSNPHYGALQAFEGMSLGTAQVVQDGSVAVKSKAANGTTGSATLYYTSTENPGVAYMESGMNGSSYLASSKYFEWVLGGTETAYWLADNLTFKSYVTAYGPTRYTLTVQGEVTETVYQPSTDSKWTLWHNGESAAELSAVTEQTLIGTRSCSTAAVQSVSVPLTSISSGTITYDVCRHGSADASRVLTVQVSVDGGVNWKNVRTIRSQEFDQTQTYSSYSDNLAEIMVDGSSLIPRTAVALFRWYASGVNGSAGFKVKNPKVTTVKGTSVETELGTVVVDKEENGEGKYYASTNDQVSIVFSQSVEVTGTQKKTFRLYGWRATGSVAEDEADTTFTGDGNWGINNLVLYGILSGPKGKEVTDHDLNQGAWTNTLEVQDGLLTGYDTVRSGLWVASNSADNCHAWVPDFTVYYPEASSKSGAEFWSSNLVELAYAEAELANGVNPDFADDDDGWTLAGDADVVAGTTTSGKWLLLPGDDSKAASASQTITVATPERGLEGVTVIVQARVRSVVAAGDAGAANGFTLGADFQTTAGSSLSIGGTETFSATKAWHDYTLGPLSVTNSSVGKVAVSIAEETEAGTGLEVDSVLIAVSAFAPMVNEAPGTAKNGEMVSAQLKVRTQGLSAETLAKGMPLSAKSGSTQPANQHYTIVSRVYDYDHDRNGDARAATVTDAFWLYDNDEAAPQTGSQFGGPFGVKVNGTLLPTKQRINSGTASVWALSDHSIAEAAGSTSGSKLGFALDYYDFSGWRVTGLQFRKLNPATGAEAGTTTVLSGGTVSAAGTLASGYSRDAANTRDEGDANVPSATVGWEQAVMDFYALHATEFASDAIVTNAVWADVTDLDNDRAGDTLATGLAHVGNFRVMDQDVSAPHYRNASTSKFKGILVATNVADGATLQDLDSADYGHYALGGSLDAHNRSLDDIATRAFTIYDGELREVSASKQFAVTADLVDPSDRTSGRSNTGVKRGTAATVGASSALASSITLTNTYLAWETAATNGIVVSNALAHYQLPGTGWSSSDGQTKMAASVSFTTWTWDEFSYDDVGNLLPSGQDYRDLWLRIHAYDADADRQEDQKYAQLAGPKITVRDNDTLWPNPPTGLEVNGTPVTTVGEMTRETAPWTNNLGNVNVRFTAATDQDPTGLDTKKSDVVRYHLAGEDATITHTSTNAGKKITTSVDGEKLKANLGAVTMDQGFGKYQLFAVDGDNDRPGDGLASDPVDVPLAYDITKPTKIGYVSGGSPRRLTANPDNTDDPTTQFDLSWPIYGVGPDDPADPNYIETTYKASAYETLSPWYSYKIYFTNYEESAIASDDNPDVEAKSWVYQTFMSDPTAANYYTNWAFVMTNSPVQDPTAPKDTGTGRSTAYDSLGRVAANVGTTNQSIRLYDLDFDNHYIVIIVGVDKAGNEGPAGMWSWATNNTIKFAVTQGVIRASSAINAAVGVASGTNSVGMAPITGDNAPAKAAALYWMAAGMKDGVGNVSKYYDLIYRDASSFNELGNETWYMASADGGNSGVSKTNWNYQADAGLSTPGRLRFFRASYHDRWQDKKPGTQEDQYPLASEEVYSMNNIVLSEGWNYVSLQGVPWTNTFRGVFGTDTDMWPGAGTTAADSANATRIEFYQPGTTASVREWYFFGKDGEWYASSGTKVTDTLQPDGFFAKPFGIVLPNAVTNESGEITGGWWKDHSDYAGAKASASKSVEAMMWHPILQVPTNAPAGGFSQTVTRGEGMYNTLSLNLPVSVHPRQLGLVATNSDGTVTSGKMTVNNLPALADQLYVIDSATKEVRGGATMFCDANGEWRYAKGTYPNYPKVAGTPIQPNDILVLISGSGSGTWTWTYTPEQFYKLPDRHMGRKLEATP